ncbi:hypothetical protein AB0F72_36580 [Actinoplanes sp. NPDC023936]|uniref:DUF3188 domain-containing protein n=1 Tax=Actinoplanes sp. NPDC023936 TaxID=3154910 RepID=UPI0033D11A8A
MRYLAAVPLVALGVAAVIFGESDDSPGLQAIGVVLVCAAVYVFLRMTRRAR